MGDPQVPEILMRDYILGVFLDDELRGRTTRLVPQPSPLDPEGAAVILKTNVKHFLLPVPEGEELLAHLKLAVAREERRLGFYSQCDKCGISVDSRDPGASCFCD